MCPLLYTNKQNKKAKGYDTTRAIGLCNSLKHYIVKMKLGVVIKSRVTKYIISDVMGSSNRGGGFPPRSQDKQGMGTWRHVLLMSWHLVHTVLQSEVS